MQSFLEQRHQRAMVDLEQEMSAALEKERDDLNKQMEMELQKELQVRCCLHYRNGALEAASGEVLLTLL